MKFTLRLLAWLLLAAGLFLTWKFFSIIGQYYNYEKAGPIDMSATGQVGDWLGGVVGTIVSLAGFVMLYLTFRQQNDSFQAERFENNFFEMIRFHRENVGELKFGFFEKDEDDNENKGMSKNEYEGRQVFVAIFKQFLNCSNEIKNFFDVPKEDIFVASYLRKLEDLSTERGSEIPYRFLARIDIAYSIVFFGVSSDGTLILRKLFRNRYQEKFIERLLKYVGLKPTMDSPLWYKWRKLSKRNSFDSRISLTEKIYLNRNKKPRTLSLQEIDSLSKDEEIVWNYDNKFTKYYGGHQFRLGHYFRHLFQTVNFVDNQSFLSYGKKYRYVKNLRAQLSTFEQALLFLNSLSSMGNVWELTPDYKKSPLFWVDQKRKLNKQLITKYNLIKNLPGETLYGIPFRYFYPEVQYELENKERNNKRYS